MFDKLKNQVQARLAALVANGPLFFVELDRDAVWKTYLDAIPVEFRQANACNCCKSFLRQFGGIVGIKDNQIITLWDFEFESAEYGDAVKALRAYVASLPITGPYFNSFEKLGTDRSPDPKHSVVWEHFHMKLPRQFVKPEAAIAPAVGAARDDRNVLLRSVNEITPNAVATVLELMAQNSLYRGDESKGLVEAFQRLQKAALAISVGQRENWAWVASGSVGSALCRIRNSAIGTLLNDLTEGRDLDAAVSAWERVMAPASYKRPTALVTPRMVEAARDRLNELGLTSALERRLLNDRDLTVANALHVYRPTSRATDVFSQLAQDAVVNPRSLTKVEEISIEDFITKVLPTSKAVRVLVENPHLGNFVSLVGPVDPSAPSLFKWNNAFSWSYAGEVASSVRERVKAAGGSVTGIIRVSLSWHNFDDLDLHLIEPDGHEIMYTNKRIVSRCGGMLDVDMNAGGGTTREPVENITYQAWPTKEGRYRVVVHQFSHREHADSGFEIEVEVAGELYNFVFAKNGPTRKEHPVVEFTYSRKDGVKVIGSGATVTRYNSTEKWGVKTGVWHQVSAITLSPNHWGTDVGNKHFFFLLEGCKTDQRVRPFYNEFLREDLTVDRKVFEILGSKVEVQPSERELSGIGFDSTVRTHLFVEVEGTFKRVLKIKF